MSKAHATPAPLRVLLPAAFTLAAGIGLALAFADDAQAADRAPAVSVEQAALRAPASADAELSPRLAKADPAGRVLRSPAERVREAAQGTTRTVSKTGRHATHAASRVTDAADEATAPLPVVGKTVDQVTDRVSEILDTAPTGMDSPRLPGLGNLLDGLDGDSGGPGQASPAAALTAAAPQTALGPAREHPPLVTAGPGADLTRLAGGAGAAAAIRSAESRDARPTPARPGVPDAPAAGTSRLTAAASSSSDSHSLLPTSRWSTIPSWQHAITTYIADRDGHFEPPSPPPG
ncbi:hypothetical protein ACGFIY_21675 [Micromonospora chersina]|uniref:hypothetical protein n=1 Tax=Micromonospora chersina TaxID=47854 RepID=UPI003716A827